MTGLTARQQKVVDIIAAYSKEHGYPPTIREIGAKMGIRSTNGVNEHLRALERKGYLRRAGGAISRGLVLATPDKAPLSPVIPYEPIRHPVNRCGECERTARLMTTIMGQLRAAMARIDLCCAVGREKATAAE